MRVLSTHSLINVHVYIYTLLWLSFNTTWSAQYWAEDSVDRLLHCLHKGLFAYVWANMRERQRGEADKVRAASHASWPEQGIEVGGEGCVGTAGAGECRHSDSLVGMGHNYLI